MEEWLKSNVTTNLLGWGFNTVGWNQEHEPNVLRHSSFLKNINA